MFTTILACIIANILTLAIGAAVGYYFYKKNETKIKEVVSDTKEKAANISETITSVSDAINSLKEKMDKLPF